MYPTPEHQLYRNAMRISTRNLAILLLICCNLTYGFSDGIRIKTFEAQETTSETLVIRLPPNQSLTLRCQIESSGLPYVVRIKSEDGLILADHRGASDSSLRHTITSVTCHLIGEFACEVEDETSGQIINSILYLMVEHCFPRTCKGLKPQLSVAAPLHSNGSFSLCVVADTSRFIDIKVFINGMRFKLNDYHSKYKFDLERNEPSYIHFTIYLIFLNVMPADYGIYNITATTGGGYTITFIVHLDGVGEACPEEWCKTPNRTCLRLLKTGNSYKKSKGKCEHIGGSLFNGTINQSTQCINSSLLNTNRSEHIVMYESNQACSIYTLDNYTQKYTTDCASTSDFSFVCQIPYWSELRKIQTVSDPTLPQDESNENSKTLFVFLVGTIVLIVFGSFIGVVCYKKRGRSMKSKSFKSRLLESSTTTDTSLFANAKRESIYHTLDEATLECTKDTDGEDAYDITVDEPCHEDLISLHFKRDSIKPIPPPRSSEKNKSSSKNTDLSLYDVCEAQSNDRPLMGIVDTTVEKHINIKEKENENIENENVENDFARLIVNKDNEIPLHRTLINEHYNPDSAEIIYFSKNEIEFKNSTHEYTTPLRYQEEHQYSAYAKESETREEYLVHPDKSTDAATHELHIEDTCQVLVCKNEDQSIRNVKEYKTTTANNTEIVCSIKENSKSSIPSLDDTDTYQGYYSWLVKHGDEHSYALFSRSDSSTIDSLTQTGTKLSEAPTDEPTSTEAVIEKPKVTCKSIMESDAYGRSRASYIDLADQVNNAEREIALSVACNNSHEQECVIKYNDSKKRENHSALNIYVGYKAKDEIALNTTTALELNEYITPVDPEMYPRMPTEDKMTTGSDSIDTDNWYLKFDGVDCDDDRQSKLGCDSNDGYMTWDGGDDGGDEEISNNNKQMVACSNTKSCNDKIEEKYLVYWTPDGTKNSKLENVNQPLPDEYSAPYDFLTNMEFKIECHK